MNSSSQFKNSHHWPEDSVTLNAANKSDFCHLLPVVGDGEPHRKRKQLVLPLCPILQHGVQALGRSESRAELSWKFKLWIRSNTGRSGSNPIRVQTFPKSKFKSDSSLNSEWTRPGLLERYWYCQNGMTIHQVLFTPSNCMSILKWLQFVTLKTEYRWWHLS